MSAAVLFLLLLGNKTANYGVLKNELTLMGKHSNLVSTTNSIEGGPLLAPKEDTETKRHSEVNDMLLPLSLISELNIAKENYLMMNDKININLNLKVTDRALTVTVKSLSNNPLEVTRRHRKKNKGFHRILRKTFTRKSGINHDSVQPTVNQFYAPTYNQNNALEHKRQNAEPKVPVVNKITAPIYTSSMYPSRKSNENTETSFTGDDSLLIFFGERKPLKYDKNLVKNVKNYNKTATPIFSTTEKIYFASDKEKSTVSQDVIFNKAMYINQIHRTSKPKTRNAKRRYISNKPYTMSTERYKDNHRTFASTNLQNPTTTHYAITNHQRTLPTISKYKVTKIYSESNIQNETITGLSTALEHKRQIKEKYIPTTEVIPKKGVHIPSNEPSHKSSVIISTDEDSLPIFSDKKKPLPVDYNKYNNKNVVGNKSANDTTPIYPTSELIYSASDRVSEIVSQNIILSKMMYIKQSSSVGSTLTNYKYPKTIYNANIGYQKELHAVRNKEGRKINIENNTYIEAITRLKSETKYDDSTTNLINKISTPIFIPTIDPSHMSNENDVSISSNVDDKRHIEIGTESTVKSKYISTTEDIGKTSTLEHTPSIGPNRKSSENNITISTSKAILASRDYPKHEKLSTIDYNYRAENVRENKTTTAIFSTTELIYLADDQVSDRVSNDIFSKTMYTTQSNSVDYTLSNSQYLTTILYNIDYQRKSTIVINTQVNKTNLEGNSQNDSTIASNSSLDYINVNTTSTQLFNDPMMLTTDLTSNSPVTDICVEETDIIELLFENSTKTQIKGNVFYDDESKIKPNKASSESNFNEFDNKYETTVITPMQCSNEVQTTYNDDYESFEKNKTFKNSVDYNIGITTTFFKANNTVTSSVEPSRISHENNVTISNREDIFSILTKQEKQFTLDHNINGATNVMVNSPNETASSIFSATELIYLANDQVSDLVSQDVYTRKTYITYPINSTLANSQYPTRILFPNTEYRRKTSVVSKDSKINFESNSQNVASNLLLEFYTIKPPLFNTTKSFNMMLTSSMISKSPVTEICLEDIKNKVFDNSTETQIIGNVYKVDEIKEKRMKSSPENGFNYDQYYVESEKNETTKKSLDYNVSTTETTTFKRRYLSSNHTDFAIVNNNMISERHNDYHTSATTAAGTHKFIANKGMPKIMNGVQMPFHAVIYQSILNIITMACDGVIINYRWVITAAHCVDISATVLGLPQKFYAHVNSTIGAFKIVVGASNPKIDGDTYKASHIVMHPNWNLTRQLNNIALIKTSKKIIFKPGWVGAIEFVKKEDELKVVQSYGWVGLMWKSMQPPSKETFTAAVLSQSECKIAIELGVQMGSATSFQDVASQICMMPLHRGNCSSNSGGPIVADGKLVGIGEFDECDDDHTLLGIKVSFYAEWIKSTMETYKFN